MHLRRQRYQDVLLVRGTPTPGPRISFAAGDDDLAARAQLLAAAGAGGGTGGGTVEGPVDTPWFSRDLVATDRDGYVVVLTAPRFADIAADPEWTATVVGSLGRRPGDEQG